MPHSISALLDQARQDPVILEDYCTLLKMPTISASPEHADDMQECASWLTARLRHTGLSVQEFGLPGHPPILLAERHTADELPTLLLYSHYDVQPPGPEEEWITPPFQPKILHGEVYARGAQDNKGQIASILAALRHSLNSGPLPCNLQWLIEGEEEVGSSSLAATLAHLQPSLRAQDCLMVDGGIASLDAPTVELGARGIASWTIELRGSDCDLHSGQLGGLAYNPLRALTELLGSLHDGEGRVTIPGFYDGVEEDPTWSSQLVAGPTLETLTDQFGLKALGGEQGRSTQERCWLRPTLEINGLHGGYSGPGFKTVIPAVATAKLSARLVHGQDPSAIDTLLRTYLYQQLPRGMELEVTEEGRGAAFRGDPQGALTRAARSAFSSVLGCPCGLAMTGGSLPIGSSLAQSVPGSILVCGLGLPTDQIHAPNEHFSIDRLLLGCVLLQVLWKEYGQEAAMPRRVTH